MISPNDLKNWFTYHAPTPEQTEKYHALRRAAMEYAGKIIDLTPPSADQTAAIRLVRESLMTANASIACEEKSFAVQD